MKELLNKWRQLGIVELQQELQDLTKQMFKLKMQHAIGELKQVHQLKNIKKNIARVLLVINEKNRIK